MIMLMKLAAWWGGVKSGTNFSHIDEQFWFRVQAIGCMSESFPMIGNLA